MKILSRTLSFGTTFCLLLAVTTLAPQHAAFADDGKHDLAQISIEVHTLDERYPAGGIQTSESAEMAIQESVAAQDRLQNWYVVAEHHCYHTFFVNDCLKEIKLERRQYLPTLQRISLEAKTLQRQIKVMEHDRETAQKQSK